MSINFDEISAFTAFDKGEKFNDEEQVREYFTVDNIIEMFGECAFSQAELDRWANRVLQERRHCDF